MGEQRVKAAQRQFQDAAAAFTRRQYAEALPLLERGAAEGDPQSHNLLGVMVLNGMGTNMDPRRAAGLFEMAAAADLREARYNLANLKLHGLGTAHDEPGAQEHLLAAARAGHRPALRALGFLYRAAGPEARWAGLSAQCFRQAAEAGDPLAQYSYGLSLLQGHGTAADPLAAARWFAMAARAGIYLAPARLAQAQAAGAMAAPASMPPQPLDAWVLPPLAPVVPSRESAFMSEHRRALDGHVEDHLINVAAPQLMPSNVVDPDTGAAVQSTLRTSHSMHFQPSMYDASVFLALRGIAHIAGLPASHAEPLGVLRYGPGQEYRPHYDYYSDDQHHAQRVTTVFVYLNDVAEGGGTDFPRLGIKVDPEQGKAVKFLNCDASGKPNLETLHAGLPVVRGEKWLATLWFWDRPFDWFR
ncbi:MAG TPA: 2OG-Fe(II) oxygenase [Gammaproteobacteria bacterium]|nr:2OG-Fe(II) oxygenase [Gammaproteobacteria bacterium]